MRGREKGNEKIKKMSHLEENGKKKCQLTGWGFSVSKTQIFLTAGAD